MVLSTPTFPFVTPPMDRKSRACQNVVENAKPMQDSTRKKGLTRLRYVKKLCPLLNRDSLVPPNPIIKTVFRPNKLESAIRPHIRAVIN